jgi:uncharacterized protein YjaZ
MAGDLKFSGITKKKQTMKKILVLGYAGILILSIAACDNTKKGRNSSKYIIPKENGRIIMAYKAFEDFLDSDKSWASYKKILLDAYPEMQEVHDKQLSWGTIDSVKFRGEVRNFKKEDFEHYFTQYDEEFLNILYDSVIGNAHKVLAPVSDNPVDLCLYLPYGGCFINPKADRNTIFISLYINPADVKKIMIHEYSHNLHFQRRPDEQMSLKSELVAEGMAVYLTTLIDRDFTLLNGIPFMPETSVKWCIANEQLIKDSIYPELNDTSNSYMFKYIADGSIAKPPEGFVEKTAYFAGYRVIESCVSKGMKLEEICSLNSDQVIEKSGYFK